MAESDFALADALADIPFLDIQIASQLKSQKLLRETWPDLHKWFRCETLFPAMRKPCLEFMVRSELLRILREAWRTNFPEHTPHSLDFSSDVDRFLVAVPGRAPAWIRTILSELETFPEFLKDYVASNPAASQYDDNALEPTIHLFVKRLSNHMNPPLANKKKRLSAKDQTLANEIGLEKIRSCTTAQLWRLYRPKFREPGGRGASMHAFRARIGRIRRHHNIPTPSKFSKQENDGSEKN